VLWYYGGAVQRVGAQDTAFASRNTPCMFSVDGVWDDPQDSERCIAWVRDVVASLQPYSSGGLYANFSGDQERAQTLYGPNHQRLAEIKSKYDPSNLFQLNQNVKPA
jgi:hypothetical protein